MNKKLKVAIIGPGNVGATIAILAARTQKYEIVIGARNIQKSKEVAKLIDGDTSLLSICEAVSISDIVLLTVSDDTIKQVCVDLSKKNSIRPGTIVAHCSGALSSDELLTAKTLCGAYIASIHPLQTFPNIEASLERIPGTYCYFEADPEAKGPIKKFVNDIGMQTVEIQKESKSLYHASAVVACNYLSTLMDTALELGEAAGIDRKTMWKSLEPLVTTTFENIKNIGPQRALTGPVSRGDTETVNKHLQSIKNISLNGNRLNMIYAALGTQTAKLARGKSTISAETEKELNKMFGVKDPLFK